MADKKDDSKIDVKNLIKDIAKSYGSSEEDKGKLAQLVKGIAFSDDPMAVEFMKKLDKATSDISKEVTDKKEESVNTREMFDSFKEKFSESVGRELYQFKGIDELGEFYMVVNCSSSNCKLADVLYTNISVFDFCLLLNEVIDAKDILLLTKDKRAAQTLAYNLLDSFGIDESRLTEPSIEDAIETNMHKTQDKLFEATLSQKGFW